MHVDISILCVYILRRDKTAKEKAMTMARMREGREKLKRNSNNDEVKLYPSYNQILTGIEDGKHIKFHQILRECV